MAQDDDDGLGTFFASPAGIAVIIAAVGGII
jgi:hypothetical protein